MKRMIVEFDGLVKNECGDWVSGRDRRAVFVKQAATELDLRDALDREWAILNAENPVIIGSVDDAEYPGRGSDGKYYTISREALAP
jgi:hypothetical protein